MQFHVLSLEGPDPYARAGGLASRVDGLTQSLGSLGFETHLWFVGDPNRSGHETRGNLHLHRWGQWISAYHPGGVYDGEELKRDDYARSLPPYMMAHHLLPHLRQGGRAVVLAEEWHTYHAVLHLDWLLREARLRERVSILWNANNYFGFETIDWPRLADAAAITTVSRYMKHRMQSLGADALVIPNGLGEDSFEPACTDGVSEFQHRFADRTVLVKMARFDPDKRWLLAIETVAELKRQGWHPLLIARGGSEAHGHEVLAAAKELDLKVAERFSPGPGVNPLLSCLDRLDDIDVVNLRTPVDAAGRRVLFRGADAVLANSGHEPFGLVGLETMAVGGLAVTGNTGEDYAEQGRNALVLQTTDPREFVELYRGLRQQPAEEKALRREGQRTAQEYAWPKVVRRVLLPRITLIGENR